ncbi:MAG: DUF3822 family protein [Bacteroidetes bacterium]|nr:DUF3822 family protein [Bacteroidota bacterium]
MTVSDNILPAVNRIDTLYKEVDLGNYFLSVQVGERSFSYCILDSVTNKYIGIGELKTPIAKGPGTQEIKLPLVTFLKKVVASLPILKKKFMACKVIWEGNKSTLIPEALYEEDEQKKLLSFNIEVDPDDLIFHDQLTDYHAVNIFAIPQKSAEILTLTLAVDHMSHISSVLIKSILLNYREHLAHPKVFLNVRDGWFDLIILDQIKLHYVNMFEFRQPEDLVYYTIYVLDQLGFNSDQVEVILMGKITKNSTLSTLIFKYIRKVEFAHRNPTYNFSYVFNEIPQHGYFSLLNLNQCGL